MNQLPVVNRLEDDENLSGWLQKVEKIMNPSDWEALQWRLEDRDMAEFFGMFKSRFFLALAYYAIVGLFPEGFWKRVEQGRVMVYEQSDTPSFGWTVAFPMIETISMDIDLESQEMPPSWIGKTLLVRPPFRGKHAKTIKALKKGGMILQTISDLHARSVCEAEVSVQQVLMFLRCAGGKRDMDTGEWVLNVRKYVSIRVKYLEDEGVWSYREDDEGRVLKTRLFYGLNGMIPKTSHSIFLLCLSYIMQGGNRKEVTGRRAFLADLFQDEVTVGWSHPILDAFIPRKLGNLQLGVNLVWCQDVGKDPDFMPVVEQYEYKGYSTFVHKSGKYAVIEAECTGFSRLPKSLESLIKEAGDDEDELRELVMVSKETMGHLADTFIAWLSDKLSKYTGRALWLVPSAAQLPASGEKPLEFDDVADFINSF